MGCFHGPGLDGVIALLLTLYGLDLSSWESHGKEVGKSLNDEERRRQVQCTRPFFHFCTIWPNGALGECQGEIQCSCLHTFWQTLMSQFQLGEDDRDVIQSSEHHRLLERSIQVDSQRHRLMRKTSTHVDKVSPYYLRETTNKWPGSSLQVLENHWTKVDSGSSTHHTFEILKRQTWRKYFCKWSLKIISHIISSYPPL